MQFVVYPLYISLAKFRRGTLFKEGVIFLGAPAFGHWTPYHRLRGVFWLRLGASQEDTTTLKRHEDKSRTGVGFAPPTPEGCIYGVAWTSVDSARLGG